MNMAASNDERVLVVTPTYREYDNLSELTQRLWAILPSAHLLIVDDASGDGTPGWVRHHAAFGERLHLIERPGKQGLGTAYLNGFRWALGRDYTHIFQMDADLSHDPAALPDMLEASRAGAGLVLGTRYGEGVRVLNWPAGRLALSMGAALYVRVVTGMPYTDPTGGYKCWRRGALEGLDLDRVRSNGYAFQIEMTYLAWRARCRIVEVPIVFEGRHAGSSKMSAAITREAVLAVLRLGAQRFLPETRARS